MFNLELAIKAWRREMIAAGIKTPDTLDELECHLRDAVEQEMCSGKSTAQAFAAAIQRLGGASAIQGEFQKVAGLGRLVIRAALLFVVAVFLAAMAALHVFSQGMLPPVLLSDVLLLSLVLPLLASAFARRSPNAEKPWHRAIWWGQGLGAVGGLMIILVPSHPMTGLCIAVVSCGVCACWAWSQWRAAVAQERVVS